MNRNRIPGLLGLGGFFASDPGRSAAAV